MTVRCEQCGHENDTQYHFCGMCGSPLQPVTASTRTSAAAPSPAASVPSFLSLGDEPRRNLNYLLEDEDEPSSHKGLYIVVVLLLVLGGGAAWYWWSGTWPWETRSRTDSVASSQATPTPSATVIPSQPSSSPPMTAPSAQPSPSVAVVPPPPTVNQAATPAPPPGDNGAAAPAPTTSSPEKNAPEKAADQTAAPVASDSTPGATSEAPTPVPAPPEKLQPPPAPKAHGPKPRPAVDPVSAEDRLVSDGEKYLYGNGVPQNCDRAEKNLLSAAHQENPKAYTLLGAMYATGHCVTRDLPSAYRWFARALHQDPANARLQQNLEVIWKQMTPQERQIAVQAP